MCSTSMCDLEDVPLDDDDQDSIEFKILAFYAKHHVFKSPPAVFSPKMLRTRTLSQQGLGNSSAKSWTQVLKPYRNYSSSEKDINLGKKKYSWRTLFGVTEKEEEPQNSRREIRLEFQGPVERQGRLHGQQWSRSFSNVAQRVENEAVDPRVASIANRVSEIVYSWPPLEETQGRHFKVKDNFIPQSFQFQSQGSEFKAATSKKDGEDEVIAKIVEMLKYSGDQLQKELKKDKDLMSSFQDGLSFPVFKMITDQFLKGVDTRGESEVKAQGFKAALAIDAMVKLTAIDNHPMNRVLGFGAKYLEENFSPWIQQHGGWEKVLGISREEVD
ncbi:PREDICTED: apoptosis facilitator Bcl-2-like protein 14 isoform X2 [Chinchilla lanigera]|uniref:BCL2 like 14 n=2 Tax=Chinchilla lanigera TaxID=34839 RepID=A0A8C2VXW2_CHILA|nr:PREDICTED: apoptosis facilitator Bcl-2-like protein 14 isoform X2 [Chinchilla lanigera]XP_005379011.1 PREDICTED: apoptosis facilitator Bcl-2-like protein 14 isoform X2 [Chinchilla lanigera]XP_005379012.1 PREDICTED: apoptosis facilitator Bcl-2-like protein 14 isoform X2 [Chinchilla lanigera]XP_005379013.1 PREDICTED: apoptosis facilitator Bcl-2-like protein 14 isoform X2 [Chinchilla lanigera]XP_013366932.1 PREDICTED: apoptosis facilitator Bcl-2-like protein 14 isoform X2 [Chinchilla lanigera]